MRSTSHEEYDTTREEGYKGEEYVKI